MEHNKIKELSTTELEKIITNALSEELGMKLKTVIKNIEFSTKDSMSAEHKKEIVNLSLTIINKVSENISYEDTNNDF